MFIVPTKLPLPLPEFLRGEYFARVTTQELFANEHFVRFMISCDEHITTSDRAQHYLDMFTILMVNETFLPPTDRHFSAALARGRSLPVTVDRLDRGLELCMAISGPNEGLPNAFVAYEFMACIRQFAQYTARKILRNRKARERIQQMCEALHQLTIFAFIMAIKVQLGIDPPENWQHANTSAAEGSDVVQTLDELGKVPQEEIAAAPPPPRFEASAAREGWTIWNSTNLLGKANIILAWYWDGDSAGYAEDKSLLRDGMRVIRRLLEGKDTSKIWSGEWFAAYDALASYPEPDEEIENFRELVRQKYDAAVKAERHPDQR